MFSFCALRLVILAATTLVHASPFLSSNVILSNGQEDLAQVITSCKVPNTVALTFDDGPHVYLYDVSKALIAAGAKGTFFFNGDNWGCIYSADNVERIKYAYAQGHQVASHTWAHKHLTALSFSQITDEMQRVDEALIRIIGVNPAFVRPPYGEYNDYVLQAAASRGQTVVNWDFDSGDSTGSTPAQSIQMYDDLVDRHPQTVLALNHETYERTAHEVLPHAIRVLQGKGYRLVTLAECLGMPAYQSVSAPESGTWSC